MRPKQKIVLYRIPPIGFRYTGEYRRPKIGEYFEHLTNGHVGCRDTVNSNIESRLILEKIDEQVDSAQREME